MTYRLENVPMNKKDFNKEKQLIIEITIFNGFEENTILNFLKNKNGK